jgi:hypothetical protein
MYGFRLVREHVASLEYVLQVQACKQGITKQLQQLALGKVGGAQCRRQLPVSIASE